MSRHEYFSQPNSDDDRYIVLIGRQSILSVETVQVIFDFSVCKKVTFTFGEFVP